MAAPLCGVMPLPLKYQRRHSVNARKQPKHLRPNSQNIFAAVGVKAVSTNSRITTTPIKQPSTSNPMPNLSRRLTTASEESAQATRRITVAERKIARTLLDMLREEDGRKDAMPARPCKNGTPPKNQPPRR